MYSAVRDIARELGKEVAARVHILVCDMISLAAVDAIAHRFRKTGKPLHLLVLNAGEQAVKKCEDTPIKNPWLEVIALTPFVDTGLDCFSGLC